MIKNYYTTKGEMKTIHEGKGLIHSVKLFGENDFQTKLKYVAYTKLQPGTSIGFHEHVDQREEVYVILSGTGKMKIDDNVTEVSTGDVIATPLEAKHGLENDGTTDLEVFVFWVEK